MHTEQFNHAPAELLLSPGSPRQGRPSFGSVISRFRAGHPELPSYVSLDYNTGTAAYESADYDAIAHLSPAAHDLLTGASVYREPVGSHVLLLPANGQG